MKRALLLFVVMGLSSVAHAISGWEYTGNPDRFPSLGLSYNRTILDGKYYADTYNNTWNVTNGNTFEGSNVVIDGRFPLSDYLTLSVGGGYSALDLNTRDNTVANIGGTLYQYNVPIKNSMTGYNVNVGIRWYIH